MLYTFEKIDDSHLASLADILNYYIRNTTVTFHEQELAADDMREKVYFGSPRHQGFCIMESGKLVGYCAVSPWKKQEAYKATAEINIYLHPDFMGKGIGSIALRNLEDFALQNDMEVLIAGICTENTPSMKLFERNNYQPCAHFRQVGYKFGRKLDVMYMQKFLA